MLFGAAKLIKAAQRDGPIFAIGMTQSAGENYIIVLQRAGKAWRIVHHGTAPGADVLTAVDPIAGPSTFARRGNTFVVAGLAYATTIPEPSATELVHALPISYSTDGGLSWTVTTAPAHIQVVSTTQGPLYTGPTRKSTSIIATADGFIHTAGILVREWTNPQARTGQYIAFSADGASWSLASHPDLHPGVITTNMLGIIGGVAIGAGKIVAGTDLFGTPGKILHSSDGLSWAEASLSANLFSESIAFVKGLGFVALGIYDGTATVRVMTSPDGSTWTQATELSPGRIRLAAADREKVYASTGTASTIVSSDFGATWASGASIGASPVYRLISMHRRLYALGLNFIRYRTAGVWVNMTLPTLPTGHTWNGFAGIA